MLRPGPEIAVQRADRDVADGDGRFRIAFAGHPQACRRRGRRRRASGRGARRGGPVSMKIRRIASSRRPGERLVALADFERGGGARRRGGPAAASRAAAAASSGPSGCRGSRPPRRASRRRTAEGPIAVVGGRRLPRSSRSVMNASTCSRRDRGGDVRHALFAQGTDRARGRTRSRSTGSPGSSAARPSGVATRRAGSSSSDVGRIMAGADGVGATSLRIAAGALTGVQHMRLERCRPSRDGHDSGSMCGS